MPAAVASIVQEKELLLREGMRILGLRVGRIQLLGNCVHLRPLPADQCRVAALAVRAWGAEAGCQGVPSFCRQVPVHLSGPAGRRLLGQLVPVALGGHGGQRHAVRAGRPLPLRAQQACQHPQRRPCGRAALRGRAGATLSAGALPSSRHSSQVYPAPTHPTFNLPLLRSLPLMLAFYWLVAAALLLFAYCLSTLFSKARVAGGAASVLYSLAMMPG